MMRIVKHDVSSETTTQGSQAGLAGWILTWLQTPVGERFSRLGSRLGNRSERRMQLVEVLPLGGKRQLIMVLCDGKRYLVGAGGDSVQSIAEMSGSLAVSAPAVAGLQGAGLQGVGLQGVGLQVVKQSSNESTAWQL